MNIKNYLKKVLDIPKELFKRFPESISLSILISLFIAIFLESDFMEDVFFFCLLFPIGVLFSEIYFKDNKRLRIISFVLSIIIAIFGNKYILEKNELIMRVAAIYGITLFILGIIKLFKDSKVSFKDYITTVFANLFKAHIVASILSTGILAICGIIITLFFNDASEMIIVRLEILLFGVYYIPACIYSLSKADKKTEGFIKFIIKNLLSVIVIIAFLIIYIYMLKIFITWKIPSNHIYRITSILFVLGLPIWTMVSSFEKENILVKICDKLPLAFIPFVGLQIYSLFVRIADNGITMTRYFGIFLILFEIIYILIYFIKKDKVYYLGYLLIAMSIISIIVPKLNAVDVTVNSQFNRVKYYLNKDKLTKKEKSSLYSAYEYLQGFKEGKSLTNKLTKKQKELIINGQYDYNFDNYKCYSNYGNNTINNIDVKGYSKLSQFDLYDSGNDLTFDNLRHLKINDYEVDLSGYVHNFIKSEKGQPIRMSNIIVTDSYKIEIIDVIICVDDKELESYSITGYILEK